MISPKTLCSRWSSSEYGASRISCAVSKGRSIIEMPGACVCVWVWRVTGCLTENGVRKRFAVRNERTASRGGSLREHPVRKGRQALPHARKMRVIDVADDDARPAREPIEHHAPRIDEHGVAV